MKTGRPLLFLMISLLGTSMISAQTVNWEMHYGQGMGQYVPPPGAPSIQDILKELVGNVQHGDPGGFAYANIPPQDDADWEPAPVDPEDGQLCFRMDRSALDGAFTALDFTYFQTTVNVSDPSQPFIIRYNEVDDGVRAYVFNEAHPEGAFIEGGDARLYFTPAQADLSPLFVQGENRIVLVQFDDSQTENYLKAVVIYEDDACANDTEAPQIFNELEDGTLVLFSEFIQESYDCGESPAVNPVVIDDCDESPSFDPAVTVSPNPDGTTTVTLDYTVSDASGNTNQEVYTYTRADDTEAPQIFNELEDGTLVLFSEFIQESYDCGESPAVNPVVVDNCDPEPSFDPAVTVSPNADGSTTVTLDYTVSDASGNTNQEVYTYTTTTDDTEAPQIFNQLEDGTLVLMSEFLEESYDCGETPAVNPVVVDNCDPEPSFDPIVGLSPEFDENGNIIYTVTLDYTVSDVSGNENQEIFIYTYTEGDIEAPQIMECVSSEDLYNVEVDTGYNVINGELAILQDLNAMDNCSELEALSLNYTIHQVEIDEEPGDSVTISATVFLVDEAGNVSSESCEVRLRAANPASENDPFLSEEEEVEAIEVKISPNPFYAEAMVQLELQESSAVRIEIRNMSGHLMETLTFDEVPAGQQQEFFIQRNNLPGGVYMISVITTEAHKTFRAVITR